MTIPVVLLWLRPVLLTPSLLLGFGLISTFTDRPGGAAGPSVRPIVGAVVADFEIGGHLGPSRHLADWSKNRVVCVVFVRPGCPVAERDATTVGDLSRRFEPQGVAFVGVATEAGDDPADLAQFVADHHLGFPVLLDRGMAAARLGATRTPEVVVLDDQRRIRYRGRIDDRHGIRSNRAEARNHDLADAIDDLLAGRPVRQPETEAVGCPIDQPTAVAGPEQAPTSPTYCRDIAPILERSCVSCHRTGQIGPFPLTTYQQAASRAGAIAEAVETRRMPPWHADPHHGKFRNDVRLPDQEQEQILDWVASGCPEGDRADLAVPIDRPDGWRISQPDVVVAMPQSFSIPATGVLEYQYFEVDPGFTTDQWVQAAEIVPGDRRVVHHCSVFLMPPGTTREPASQGELGSVCLATTTPGTPPMTLPPGMAKRVPAGWRFLFVVHYTPIGTVQEDRTSIGLVLADPASVGREVATNVMLDLDLRIPPHAANYPVEQTRRFEADVWLISMFPHMHLRGRSFRYEATFPDGRTEILLDVPRFDFAWQNRYDLAEPRRLRAGTSLRCLAHFDNSAANPANPNPNATVLAGPQSWDEMFNGYYEFALVDGDMPHPVGRWSTFLSDSHRLGLVSPIILAGSAIGLFMLHRQRRA